jgi:hypothetical protein
MQQATTEAVRELDLVPREAALPALKTVDVPTVVTPGDLLRIAMAAGDTDLDRLERLMAMQERHREAQERERQREAVLAFRRDFAAFRGENVVVPKTKLVDQKKKDGGQGPKFMQSEFDVVCGMLSPALSKHGFGFRHDMKFGAKAWTTDGVVSDQPWVYVTCYLEHRDGHTETLSLEGPPDTGGAKNPLQEMQSAASYFKRQSLLAITGTATGGEDDESRMRRRGATQSHGEDSSDAEGNRFDELCEQGRAAAMQGTKPLTDWWGALTKTGQKLMNAEFGAMRKAARVADERGAHA